MPTCLIDQSEHPTLEDLHKHLQHRLKVRQEAYYTKYHPRVDWHTGEPIPYKDRDQYLAAEFTCREHATKWVAANPVKGREWAVRWLAGRREAKRLTYPPSQVELATLIAPTIHHYDRYNRVCEGLGYVPRFDGTLEGGPLPAGAHVVVDTREQKPLELAATTVVGKVNCGDYALDPEHDQGVYIERKSLNDFVGTLSTRAVRGEDSNLARFTRELERAKECGGYVIILVECTLERALHFDDLPEMSHTKVSPDHTFKHLRDLLSRFDNIQALFVNGRAEAAVAVVKLLAAGASVKRVDVQFAYETGKLYLKG